ncbi:MULTISPECIES: DUF6665 family protein [unclassified Devosia]|jgi:hypothetical protein|uniref:DUF6665 family protein n=1 Tax=unclassified Devosia TaxID=196773 RepID=UPI0023D85674|nr:MULTISPECIES: DUF6665 family protein [unclassified Devosia]WEJ34875.1 hypothetical protein NYQ88_08790 [Devosia sp. SD17-2]
MSGLRASLDLIRMVRPEAGTAAIEHEILAEKANSLGAAERRVKNAVAALDADPAPKALLAEARDAVWCYFVQRELLGFEDHDEVIADLKIPRSVLIGLGAMDE